MAADRAVVNQRRFMPSRAKALIHTLSHRARSQASLMVVCAFLSGFGVLGVWVDSRVSAVAAHVQQHGYGPVDVQELERLYPLGTFFARRLGFFSPLQGWDDYGRPLQRKQILRYGAYGLLCLALAMALAALARRPPDWSAV